jgi:hypothetical protein
VRGEVLEEWDEGERGRGRENGRVGDKEYWNCSIVLMFKCSLPGLISFQSLDYSEKCNCVPEYIMIVSTKVFIVHLTQRIYRIKKH